MSKDASVQLTVIVTLHHEGILAHRTLRSLLLALQPLSLRGQNAEILLVLDKPDLGTRHLAQSWQKSPLPASISLRLVEVNFGDPGLARNTGAELASADIIGFLDGDDHPSQEWFFLALSCLQNEGKPLIVHPSLMVCFGAENYILRMPNSESNNFEIRNFIACNAWCSTCCTFKSVLQAYPIQPSLPESGYGYEDWHWNTVTLASGIPHRVLSGTAIFVRRKPKGSRNRMHDVQEAVIRSSPLFHGSSSPFNRDSPY